MAVRKRRPTRVNRLPSGAAALLSPALEKLKENLSSPRLKAPGTIASYMLTASTFLQHLGPGKIPTDSDFRQWFMRRRGQKVSERTLRKEFFILKKLATANGWPWSFTGQDTPLPEEDSFAPALLPTEVEQLIKAKNKYSRAERFYLAVATTWIVRREDLCQIQKRHYDDQTFTIHHSKHGRKVTHLIPDALKQIFADFRPRQHSTSALSQMFKRIWAKAGLPPKPGVGWHGPRRTLTTMLAALLPQNQFDPAILADYSGWSKSSLGSLYGGVAMVGLYRHPEILNADPFGRDRLIYGIHPFLPLWGKKR